MKYTLSKTVFIFILILSAGIEAQLAQDQLPQDQLKDMCEMDIELTEYLGAVLSGETPAVDDLSKEHKEQVEMLIKKNSDLDIQSKYKKIISACAEGSVFQGRY